jgi:DNA-binding NarL/FixJ family response regulator
VEEIRILLSGMPRMLREIIAEVVRAQPDMVVVGEHPADSELAEVAQQLQADVVILGAEDGGLPARGRELVYRSPRITVLAVEANGRQAWLYELRPYQTVIDQVAPNDLVSRIRAATQRVRTGEHATVSAEENRP